MKNKSLKERKLHLPMKTVLIVRVTLNQNWESAVDDITSRWESDSS